MRWLLCGEGKSVWLGFKPHINLSYSSFVKQAEEWEEILEGKEAKGQEAQRQNG